MKRKREDAAAAADGEITAAAARVASSSSSGAAICDDVVRNIFARLPARDAVASMALSRHHRRLITSPEFGRLHCRHGAPLPRPHIAYVATAVVVTHRDMFGRVKSLEEWAEQRAKHGFGTGVFAWESRYDPEQDRSSTYHGFHVTGDGRRRGTNPMRVLAGQKYNDQKYVGTCNGVILLAGKRDAVDVNPSVGLLLNPAVADNEREIYLVPSSPDEETKSYHVLGFGYGPSTRTYKLRVNGAGGLVVYSLGGSAVEQPRMVLAGVDKDNHTIRRRRSVYMDGTVYLLNVDKVPVLAFDVNDEAITSIDLPGERVAGGDPYWHVKSDLMEMSGRVCVATADGGDESLYAIRPIAGGSSGACSAATARRRRSPASGTAAVCCSFYCWPTTRSISIFLYDDATEEVSHLNVPTEASPEKSDYRICWGYKPTLVSPASIVGELSQQHEQHRDLPANALAALKPVNELDKRMGQDATLRSVCFMEFLVHIMRNLPSQFVADADVTEGAGTGTFKTDGPRTHRPTRTKKANPSYRGGRRGPVRAWSSL